MSENVGASKRVGFPWWGILGWIAAALMVVIAFTADGGFSLKPFGWIVLILGLALGVAALIVTATRR